MKVSVAVCTHQRAPVLDGCLRAIAAQEVPGGTDWEVLVVDNASTDGTAEVIRRFADAMPLRPLAEPRLGVSRARNLVLDSARGDLVLFTDDDVRPEPGWLAGHVATARVFPDAAFLGGPVEPEYLAPPPPWVVDNPEVYEGLLALRPARSWPREPTAIRRQSELPCGANFGFRPARLDGLRFDTALGRRGEGPGALEETAFLAALLERGEEGAWSPGAVVRHLVEPERLAPAYFYRWYRAWGRNAAAHRPDRVPGRARLWLRFVETSAVALALSPGKGRRWLRARRRAAKARGMLDWRAETRGSGATAPAPSAD